MSGILKCTWILKIILKFYQFCFSFVMHVILLRRHLSSTPWDLIVYDLKIIDSCFLWFWLQFFFFSFDYEKSLSLMEYMRPFTCGPNEAPSRNKSVRAWPKADNIMPTVSGSWQTDLLWGCGWGICVSQKSHVACESTPYWILKEGCCSNWYGAYIYKEISNPSFKVWNLVNWKIIPIGWFSFELSSFLNLMVIIYQLCLKSIWIELNFQGFSKSTILVILLRLMKV